MIPGGGRARPNGLDLWGAKRIYGPMLNAPRTWRDPKNLYVAAGMLAAATLPFLIFMALAWDVFRSGFGRQTWAITVAPAVALSTLLVMRWANLLTPLSLKLCIGVFAAVSGFIGGTFPISTTVLGMHRGAGSPVFTAEWWEILFTQAIWLFTAIGAAAGGLSGALFGMIASRPARAAA
jgi:hypothetical protein